MKTLKVALLGAGNVGSEVARILLRDRESLAARTGAQLELSGIAVRNPAAPRHAGLPAELLTDDPESLIEGADIVVELMGGLDPAGALVRRALERGASVVTGNKALIAAEGAALRRAADAHGAQLAYEAAVAGAIPILRPIMDSLSGDRITKVMGIVNGTTNFILDEMDTTGAQFGDVLAEAQRLGYAEADPTADVAGHDAAAKAAILASLAFHGDFPLDEVHCEGILSITAADIAAARTSGHVIKLLAVAERVGDGASVRVHPTLLSREHPLAAVHGAFNAVFVEAQNAGQLMFYGQGAGGAPTASAVAGDIVSIARRLATGAPAPGQAGAGGTLPAVPLGETSTRYSIGLKVSDETGVLSRIAAVFADHGVSIEAMRQSIGDNGDPDGRATLRFITHVAPESALAATVRDVTALGVVTEITSVLRVEGN